MVNVTNGKNFGIAMASPSIMMDSENNTLLLRYSSKHGDAKIHMFRQVSDGDYFIIASSDDKMSIEEALHHVDIHGMGAPVICDLSRADHELLVDLVTPAEEKNICFYKWDDGAIRGGAVAATTVEDVDDEGNVRISIRAAVITNEAGNTDIVTDDEFNITIAGQINGDEEVIDQLADKVPGVHALAREIILDALEFGTMVYETIQSTGVIEEYDDCDEEDEDDDVDDAFMAAFPNGGFKHKKHKKNKKDSFEKILKKMGC